MAIIRTSDLGWTSGQDVSALIEPAVQGLVAGDVFVVDHFYDLDINNVDIPAGVIFAGGAEGAGFYIVDAETSNQPSLVFQSDNIIRDLTFGASTAVEQGWNKLRFKSAIQIKGVENCERWFRPRNAECYNFQLRFHEPQPRWC